MEYKHVYNMIILLIHLIIEPNRDRANIQEQQLGKLAQHIATLLTLSNITIHQASVDILLTSIYLRETHNLSLFDSNSS